AGLDGYAVARFFDRHGRVLGEDVGQQVEIVDAAVGDNDIGQVLARRAGREEPFQCIESARRGADGDDRRFMCGGCGVVLPVFHLSSLTDMRCAFRSTGFSSRRQTETLETPCVKSRTQLEIYNRKPQAGRLLPHHRYPRSRSNRALSRCQSRLASVSRLSWILLPLASAISILT